MHSNSQASLALSLPKTAVPSEPHPLQGGHWTLLFQRDFQIKRAVSSNEQQQSYRLRHQVYCEELGFEPTNANAIEQDHYDQRSAHYLLQHRQSRSLAGTMRMVYCRQPDDKLPLTRYLSAGFIKPDLSPDAFALDSVCELSRLALASDFRRQQLNHNPALSQVNPLQVTQSNSHYRYLAAGLYLAALEQAFNEGISHAYALVAPALARMLNRVGFQFQQISNAIELNGSRAAYYLDVNSSLHTLCDDYKLLRQVLAAQLAQVGMSGIR
jgi:N-acyl amino acid synthase of PEP-CTERM/exosortase system